MIVAKGLMLFDMSRLLQVGLRDLLPWRGLLATAGLAAAAAIPAWVVVRALADHPLAGLAAAGMTYASIYLATLAALHLRRGAGGGAVKTPRAVHAEGG